MDPTTRSGELDVSKHGECERIGACDDVAVERGVRWMTKL